MDPDTAHVDLDLEDLESLYEGGAGLTVGDRVRSATVRCPELRALDVGSCPDLERLDLSACAEGIILGIGRCPRLVQVILPTTGPGGILHLSFDERLPQLLVSGLVADVDLCWSSEDHPPPGPGSWGDEVGLGPLRGRERRRPLDGLVITRPGEPLPAEVEFAVLVAGDDVEALSLPSGIREAMIVDAPALRIVRLGSGARHAALELGSLPELRELTGGAQVDYLRVEDAPALVRVDWGGRRATLVRSGGASLQLAAPLQEVLLGESAATELDARFLDELHVRGCSALRRVVVAPEGSVGVSGHSEIAEIEGAGAIEVERVTLRQVLQGAFAADDALRQAVLVWLGRRHGPTASLEAVQILHACAARGWSLPRLWEQRCALHARSCASRGHRDDGQRWAWDFPADLAARGWEADLQLWRLCRAEARRTSAESFQGPNWTDPIEYGHALATSSEPHHLLAIATAAWRQADACDPKGELLGLLLEALDHGATRGDVLAGPDARSVTLPAREFDPLQGVIRALVGLRDEPSGPRAAAVFCRWVGRRLPGEQGLDLLGALRDLGSPDATEVLAAAASSPRNPALRRRALALLMKPPTHAVLAANGATT